LTIFRGPGGGGNATSDSALNALTALTNDASNSATVAGASATAAGISAGNAASSAAAAASSASGASTSATTATTQASAASTSASGASTSASNGAASAAAALASQNAAAASEATASTAATTATTQAGLATTNGAVQVALATTQAGLATTNGAAQVALATTQAGLATTNGAAQVALATTQAGNAAASASTATSQAADASSSASAASTSETNAANSASAASGSASTAATQASASAASAVSAASSAASAATLLDNFDDRYLGAKASNPALDNDGNALVIGALYFNTTDGVMKVYTSSGWIAASSASVATLVTFEFVATAAQAVFTGNDANSVSLSYTAPALMVTINGVRLRPGDDYTATNGTSITLVVAAAAGDELVVDAFGAFLIANTYSQAQADTLLATKQAVLTSGTNIKTLNGESLLGSTDITITVPAAFASGTAMLFMQTAAPTGWTKSTTHDNKALRIVSGTAGSGGTAAFTTAFGTPAVSGSVSLSGSVGATTLSTAQIPSHTHGIGGGGDQANTGLYGGNSGGYSFTSSSTGGNGSHTHGFSGSGSLSSATAAINVQYVDAIIATKD
jgi:hypothetical protein